MPKTNVVLRQLASLNHMNLYELRDKYAEMYGCETKMTSAEFLRRRLAYRIQEIYYGGLTDEENHILAQIARADPASNLSKRKQAKYLPRGTILSREWHGAVYEVTATGAGTFEFKGHLYRSLSAVAELITGTKWNGREFFGVS